MSSDSFAQTLHCHKPISDICNKYEVCFISCYLFLASVEIARKMMILRLVSVYLECNWPLGAVSTAISIIGPSIRDIFHFLMQ